MNRHDTVPVRPSTLCLTALMAQLLFLAVAQASEVDGFTEPSKRVNVAAAETGTIKAIGVREGDRVKKGEIVAQLDDAVHRALLAIAQEGMEAQGQMKSAEAEVSLRERRLEKLETLNGQGHARQEEVDRARADLAIARARLLAAHEQLEVKRLEHNKFQVQLDRRYIRAPLKGFVNRLYKDVGEFVAANDPHVLEIVCLDPLMATFNVPSHLITRLERMRSDRTITRFGPFFDAEALGGAFCLCAMAVPEAKFETVVSQVNAHAEVAHNYERDHRLNMWFVLATETAPEIEGVAMSIERETGIRVLLFPKLREFFIGFRVAA